MSSFPILYNAFSHFSGNDCQVFAVLIHFLSNSKNELLDVLSNLVLFYFCPWFSFLKNPFLPPALSPSVNFPEWMLAFVSLPLCLRTSALWTDSALEQSLILFPCGQHAWSVWFLPLKVSVGFYIWSEAASTPGYVLQMPIQNDSCLQRTKENDIIFITIYNALSLRWADSLFSDSVQGWGCFFIF